MSPTPAPRLFGRRDLLRLAAGTGVAVAASPLLAGCGSDDAPAGVGAPATTGPAAGAPPSLGTLRIGYLPITDASPLLIAHANGTFAAAGFDTPQPTLFRSWPNLVEAFQAGQVDVVHLLMPLAVQLRFGLGQPIKVLSWNHTNGSALTVAKKVGTVADLAGTTVAIPFWFSIHNVVLQQLLRANGLTPITGGTPTATDRTVRLIVLPPPDMPPALASGDIAGFIVADPFNALAEMSGVGRVLRFTGDVWRDHACCVSVVREDLVADRPQAAQAIVDALTQAQLTLRQDRPGSARTLSEGGYLPQPPGAIERALTHYAIDEYGPTGAIAHPDWGAQRIDFQPYPFPSYTERLITELRTTLIDADTSFLGSIDLGRAHQELVAVGLAEAAIDRHGGPGAFGLTATMRSETIAP